MGVLLLRSSLFNHKMSNQITLACKTIRITRTSLDLRKLAYCFHYLLKIYKETDSHESYYFVLLCLFLKVVIVTLPHTKRCVQLARVLIETSLLIVFHFFTFGKEKSGLESYYFVLVYLASK